MEAAEAMFVHISLMRSLAAGPGRARELVRMKNPAGEFSSSRARVEGSQTVRTGMESQVWVPVGSSSRIMRVGVVGEAVRDFMVRRVGEVWMGGREARVGARGMMGYWRGVKGVEGVGRGEETEIPVMNSQIRTMPLSASLDHPLEAPMRYSW